MCDTLRNTRRRGRWAVPLIRFRCRSEMRFRRSFVVFIFIVSYQLPATSFQPDVAISNQLKAESWTLFRAGLPRLLLQDLARVADALLLVGIRLAQRADVGRDLPHELPIDARHRHVRLLVDRDVDPVRDVEHDRMRVAQREVHLLALHFRAVADADDVEILAEAVGDALDRVGHEAARQAVELAELGVLAQRLRVQLIAGDLEADAGRQRLKELALRALYLDGARLDVHLHALGDRNDLLANS